MFNLSCTMVNMLFLGVFAMLMASMFIPMYKNDGMGLYKCFGKCGDDLCTNGSDVCKAAISLESLVLILLFLTVFFSLFYSGSFFGLRYMLGSKIQSSKSVAFISAGLLVIALLLVRFGEKKNMGTDVTMDKDLIDTGMILQLVSLFTLLFVGTKLHYDKSFCSPFMFRSNFVMPRMPMMF